jgi:hypothetical protein
MKLSQLSAKPQLIKVVIDDEDIVKEHGEPIEFYTWDRQPMALFIKMANIDHTNYGNVIDAVKELVLDEHGKPVLDQDATLPTKIMMRVITKIVEGLGKF